MLAAAESREFVPVTLVNKEGESFNTSPMSNWPDLDSACSLIVAMGWDAVSLVV